MGFPEQLKLARTNIGYTQQQIADLMGITKSTYCGYETGKRKPDVLKIKQLAKILNTSGDVLLETGFYDTKTQGNNSATNFLEKLDYLMETKNLNKSSLSKNCNIPYATIDSWYKKGYDNLKLTTLCKLANFFNTTLDYWVNDNIRLENYINKSNSDIQNKINIKLNKMDNTQLKTVLSFINSLEEIERD